MPRFLLPMSWMRPSKIAARIAAGRPDPGKKSSKKNKKRARRHKKYHEKTFALHAAIFASNVLGAPIKNRGTHCGRTARKKSSKKRARRPKNTTNTLSPCMPRLLLPMYWMRPSKHDAKNKTHIPGRSMQKSQKNAGQPKKSCKKTFAPQKNFRSTIAARCPKIVRQFHTYHTETEQTSCDVQSCAFLAIDHTYTRRKKIYTHTHTQHFRSFHGPLYATRVEKNNIPQSDAGCESRGKLAKVFRKWRNSQAKVAKVAKVLRPRPTGLGSKKILSKLRRDRGVDW